MVEEVSITKYKSRNGKMYDTEQEAIQADLTWLTPPHVKMNNEISKLEKNASRDILQKSMQYPRVIISHEKYDDDYSICLSESGVLTLYLQIVKTRLSSYFYIGDDKLIAEEIVNTNNQIAAYGWLMKRNHYEYENIENISVTVYE